MNRETIDRIISENKTWIEHNFDFEAPELGLVEEIGEYAHQVLKAGQGIRITSPELRKDALADMVIFYFHLCWKYDHDIAQDQFSTTRALGWHLGTLAMFSGKLLCGITDHQRADSIFMYGIWEHINAIATLEGWDLEALVVEVWDAVKKRDFRLYPGTGLPPELPTADTGTPSDVVLDPTN